MYLLDASVFLQLAPSEDDTEFSRVLSTLDALFTALRAGSVQPVLQEVKKTVAAEEMRSWVKSHASGFYTTDRFSTPMLPKVSAAITSEHELSASAAFMEGSELFVVSQALANPEGTTVVTCEPHTTDHWKVTVPTACEAVGVSWMTPQEMLLREKVACDFPGWGDKSSPRESRRTLP